MNKPNGRKAARVNPARKSIKPTPKNNQARRRRAPELTIQGDVVTLRGPLAARVVKSAEARGISPAEELLRRLQLASGGDPVTGDREFKVSVGWQTHLSRVLDAVHRLEPAISGEEILHAWLHDIARHAASNYEKARDLATTARNFYELGNIIAGKFANAVRRPGKSQGKGGRQ